jgi:hypothetical protein
VIVTDGDPIPVEIEKLSWTSDWASLFRTDGHQFEAGHIVEICASDRIPKDDDEAKIKIYHCPVILFINEDISLLRPMSIESKLGSSSKHSFLFQVGLFAGSSGALVVLSNGLAVGMHLEAVNSATSMEQLLAECRAAGEPEGTFEENMTSVSDSCVQSVGALSRAIFLSRNSRLMAALVDI